MMFTDRGVLALKPRATRYVIWEENAYGQGSLGLRVTPTGTKTFVYMYRFDGKPRMQTIGSYPVVSVAQAREAFGKATRVREEGVDPGSDAVEQHRAARAMLTVTALVDEYIERYAKKRKRSWAEDKRILDKNVVPVLGRHKVDGVTRRHIVALLDDMVARGAPIGANRTLAVVRKMFNWAVARDELPISPCHGIQAPAKENRRSRVLEDTELKRVLGRLHGIPTSRLTQLALHFQLLTAQRCGEVLGALWSEMDIKNALWTLPSAKVKNGEEHRVPLSKQALDILKQVKALRSDSPYVFPSPRSKGRETSEPMVETVMARAVNRNLTVFGVAAFTPHDLRRTAATHMTAMGTSRLVVEKILNHVDRSVAGIYDRHSYDSEKRAALDAWGAKVFDLMVVGVLEAEAEAKAALAA